MLYSSCSVDKAAPAVVNICSARQKKCYNTSIVERASYLTPPPCIGFGCKSIGRGFKPIYYVLVRLLYGYFISLLQDMEFGMYHFFVRRFFHFSGTWPILLRNTIFIISSRSYTTLPQDTIDENHFSEINEEYDNIISRSPSKFPLTSFSPRCRPRKPHAHAYKTLLEG